MSKYSGAEKIASCAFILFVLSFTMLRVVYYPFWVLRSTRFVLNQFPIYVLFSFCPLSKFSIFVSVVANLGELYNVFKHLIGS
jgi:hypothetical protein